MSEIDRLMTYNKYAIMKGCTQQTVRNWVATGRVERVKIEGRSFVKLTDEEMELRKELGF